jgi:hypothetical protein
MTPKRPAAFLSAPVLPNDLTSLLIEKIMALRPSVKTDYLKAEILSKYVSAETDPPIVRRTRAINKWLATEAENEATNDRLLITPEEYNILPRVTFISFIEWCRHYIRDVIGDTPPVDALIGSFSGGASTSRSRTSSQPSSKYLGKAHVTARCLDIFSSIEDEMPGWLAEGDRLKPEIVIGNVLFTVPKKTDIDRVACKEPDLNMFIQKGIGNYFRKCLRRAGINLNDQSINQSLAHEGSVSGKLCTLDLSSASDSVTEGLIALLLPEIWYTLLDAVRCQVTVIDGEEHRNSMFSSMGNGFTFELESLIFLVLTRATAYFTGTKGVVSVYGDDIICSTDMSKDLIWILSYFGFSVNTEKSCLTGPYRESCGGHYWNGLDITPFYIRSPISSLHDLIDVANKLRQWAHIDGIGILDPEVEAIWLWLKSFVPNILWGGEDTSFKYQLVSLDTSSHRLTEMRRSKDAGTGGYFHWLNATWDRIRLYDGVQTSSYSLTLPGRIRLKRVRKPTVPQLLAIFPSEV